MIDNRFKDDLKQIADILGYEEQSMQLIEEMAELTQAINKYRRYEYDEMRCNIIEEIADVSIVLEQVAYLLETDMKRLNVTVAEKIERTKRRIAEKGKNIE